jgi:phosphatidylcholine synthase
MRDLVPAFAVHVFTALGAVLGFQALLAAAGHRWEAAFAWLGAALIVDALDGPMARRIRVREKLPRFSGERLDLVIDYVTYVLVPAYMIYEAGLIPAPLNSVAAAAILLSSLFHFSDCESKTDDGFFVGFPTLWNIVAFYLFALPLPGAAAFAAVAGLAALTFIPLKWVHPVRSRRLRPVTAGVVVAWGAAAIGVLATGFPASLPLQTVLAASAVYFAAVGLLRSAQDATSAAAADQFIP